VIAYNVVHKETVRVSGMLTELRRELDAFRDCLHDDLSAPIEHCPGWTLYDLADHMGRGNLWVATAVREKRSEFPADAAPRDGLVAWFEDTSTAMLDALAADPDTEAWTFAPTRTVGFWRRRRLHETIMHRWDAEHALGRVTPIDPALAADGVAEVFALFAPRMIKRGKAREPEVAIRLRATDTGESWDYGPGEPVAELAATAEDLLLMLWGRLPQTHSAIEWSGDKAAAESVLAGPLTP